MGGCTAIWKSLNQKSKCFFNTLIEYDQVEENFLRTIYPPTYKLIHPNAESPDGIDLLIAGISDISTEYWMEKMRMRDWSAYKETLIVCDAEYSVTKSRNGLLELEILNNLHQLSLLIPGSVVLLKQYASSEEYVSWFLGKCRENFQHFSILTSSFSPYKSREIFILLFLPIPDSEKTQKSLTMRNSDKILNEIKTVIPSQYVDIHISGPESSRLLQSRLESYLMYFGYFGQMDPSLIKEDIYCQFQRWANQHIHTEWYQSSRHNPIKQFLSNDLIVRIKVGFLILFMIHWTPVQIVTHLETTVKNTSLVVLTTKYGSCQVFLVSKEGRKMIKKSPLNEHAAYVGESHDTLNGSLPMRVYWRMKGIIDFLSWDIATLSNSLDKVHLHCYTGKGKEVFNSLIQMLTQAFDLKSEEESEQDNNNSS